MSDPAALLAMADACGRAADPALTLASEVAACLAACPDAGPGFLRAAADLGTYASRLHGAAHYLRDQAKNTQLQEILAHLAAGGTVEFHYARPVVVGPQHAPKPMTLVQRLGRAARRPFQRRAA